MDVPVKLGDSQLNNGRINQLFADRTRLMHICAVFNFILQPTGSSDGRFVRLIVSDKCAQFGYTCLNRSREIRPKAIGGRIFTINSNQKQLVMSYPVWLQTRSVWMSV